ncbi:hypothetical protein BGX28_009512 [Mortierella sp. GBA30]|nr:hypothetical protein BGX28_009512 [Mortierella sp. GBA30]
MQTKEIQTTGQTTMDSFMSRTPRDLASSSSIPQIPTDIRPRQLMFVPNPSTTVTGTTALIPKAKLLLEASIKQGVSRQAFLADPSVMFFQSDKTDQAWGCGYRNLQMMLSYVVSQSVSNWDPSDNHGNLPGPESKVDVPTITDLQKQLEYAWKCGFDRPGAEQLKHKVEGTKKWIGTTEAWSVLCSLGIRCSILDFHTPTGPNSTHPAMLAAIYNYFRTPAWSPLSAPGSVQFSSYVQSDNDQRIIQTAKPPLYMQHQGHSRTIIGVEVLASGELNLLVFDPGRWLHKAIPTMKEASISRSKTSSMGSKLMTEGGLLDPQYLLKAFRLSLGSGITKAQYQLLGISGLYHEDGRNVKFYQRNIIRLLSEEAALSIGWNDEERQQSKFITSTRVP